MPYRSDQDVGLTPMGFTQQRQWGDSSMHGNKSLQFNQMQALNPMQVQLQNALLGRFMGGGGEFGFGGGAKQAQATLGRAGQRRGISPDSGVMQSAMGGMLAQALQGDVQNRRNYGLGLMTQSPQHFLALQRQLGKQKGPGAGDYIGQAIGGALPYGVAGAFGAYS